MTQICIFGASTVWGAWDLEGGGWAHRLKMYVGKLSLESNDEKDHEIYVLGISGQTSEDLLNRLDNEASVRKADVILISIGVNDSSYVKDKNMVKVPVDVFRKNIEELIKRSKKHTDKILFVGPQLVDEKGTMPWWENLYFENKNLKNYNEIIKSTCEKESVLFIDLIEKQENEDYKSLLLDSLHPNAEGHKRIFEEVKKVLLEKKWI